MKTILSIAGSDCSGGAGIQADIKTITAHRLYAMSVITALTAQNTTGVKGVLDVDSQFVAQQMDMVFSDIFPDAVKIGMVSNKEIIAVVAGKLKEYGAAKVVLDPVMISTSGRKLLGDDAITMLITRLMPLADIITPNIPEAEVLCGFPIRRKEDMQSAAIAIAKKYKGNILIKGGHLKDSCDDLLYAGESFLWYTQENIDNPNTHGTGCTLSSAIACNLAAGMDISKSVAAAKAYITGAIKSNLDLGKGNGPLNHSWNFI